MVIVKPEDNYNIIQILLDGLRHDKVDSSSSLRSIKENSIYFSNMITAAPLSIALLINFSPFVLFPFIAKKMKPFLTS